jgi:hypothetical protein
LVNDCPKELAAFLGPQNFDQFINTGFNFGLMQLENAKFCFFMGAHCKTWASAQAF